MKPQVLIAALLLAAAPVMAPASAQTPQSAPAPAPAGPSGLVPLSRVLKMLGTQHPGKQINTTMGEAGGRPAYLVQWLLINGRMAVFTVDAQTGQVVGKQGG